MNVLVDHREHSRAVTRVLRDRGCDIEIAQLKTGDYLVDGLLIVERKTLPDFALSIMDGRLFKQANRLARSAISSVIILEGGRLDAAGIAVKREAMQGALISLSLVYRIPILRSLEPRETASLMIYAANQLVKKRDGALRIPGYRPKGKRKQQLYVLQALPNIGPRRAERLLGHFGSVEAVIEADPEERTLVNGLGPDIANKINHIIRESRSEYGRADGHFPVIPAAGITG